jgi:hypothetical protein
MNTQLQGQGSKVQAVGCRFDGAHREGMRMRRTSAVLVVLFSGMTGCSGTEAQVPNDGVMAVAQRPGAAAPAAAAQPAIAEPVASEPNVPWAIALLSDAPERPIKRAGKVTIVEAKSDALDVPEAIAQEADVQVALQPEPLVEKPADEKPAPKACSGVVNRRS